MHIGADIHALKEHVRPVVVVGGANTDISGRSHAPLVARDSNPGDVRISSGGVGRNVAENLTRLGVGVQLLTAFGNDRNGRELADGCRAAEIDIAGALFVSDVPGSVYLSIVDDAGDMALALSDMRALDRLTPAALESRRHILDVAELVVADTNLPPESLVWLAEHVSAPIVLDTVSVAKAPRAEAIFAHVHTLKATGLEAGTLLGVEVRNRDHAEEAARELVARGIGRAIVTTGAFGAAWADGSGSGHMPAPAVDEVRNATGAGDAFAAGVAYATLQAWDVQRAVAFGLACATIALESELTVSESMSIETGDRARRGHGLVSAADSSAARRVGSPGSFVISDEVARALRDGAPVVALESTIISHGFPYPANLECALRAEEIVREGGAVPATIAILGGSVTVGLDAAQIEHLAKAGPERVSKASRRDIATLVARGEDGATTVAGTLVIAARAGIRVFATGGIGGVHRGAQETFDISADLLELARADVAVVCAGAKSILDIGLTLEVLETHGVPVLGYRTDEFPAFYLRSSGHPVDARFDTPQDLARVLRVRRELALEGGVVIANPISRGARARPGVARGDHRRGARRGRRARRSGARRDPVPARADPRTQRGRERGGQQAARVQQRAARGRDRSRTLACRRVEANADGLIASPPRAASKARRGSAPASGPRRAAGRRVAPD